jgi:hypothetical protein
MGLPGEKPEAGKLGQNSLYLPRFDIQTVILADFLRCFDAFFDNGPGVGLGPVIVVQRGVPHPQKADEEDSGEGSGEEDISMHGSFSM